MKIFQLIPNKVDNLLQLMISLTSSGWKLGMSVQLFKAYEIGLGLACCLLYQILVQVFDFFYCCLVDTNGP